MAPLCHSHQIFLINKDFLVYWWGSSRYMQAIFQKFMELKEDHIFWMWIYVICWHLVCPMMPCMIFWKVLLPWKLINSYLNIVFQTLFLNIMFQTVKLFFLCLSSILNFNYGYSEESDKPVPILSTTLFDSKKSLRCLSSFFCFVYCFYLYLLGTKSEKVMNTGLVFRFWGKSLILFSPPWYLQTCMCSSLKLLVLEHHTKFVQLFGEDHYIPNVHFLLHYPEQIIHGFGAHD